MTEVARRVGLSKPTLYHYFRNKEELLICLYEDVMNESLISAERFERGVKNPLEALRQLLIYRIRYICEHQAIHKVFFEEEEEIPKDLLVSILTMRGEFEDVMKRLTIRHLEQTDRLLPVSVTVFVNTCLGAANWVYKWYNPDGSRDAQQLGEEIAGLVLLPLTCP